MRSGGAGPEKHLPVVKLVRTPRATGLDERPSTFNEGRLAVPLLSKKATVNWAAVSWTEHAESRRPEHKSAREHFSRVPSERSETERLFLSLGPIMTAFSIIQNDEHPENMTTRHVMLCNARKPKICSGSAKESGV